MTGERAPARTVALNSVDGLVGAMREAAARGEALMFAGGGTHNGWGYPVERVDATISTEHLRQIVGYAPDDMTVTVEAGVTLGALQATVRAHGQRLAFDAPLPERATVGGLIATNDYGPLRTRFGTLRDLILGAAFVRPNGVLARGGGRVVKNVAGFDLPKLLVGSLGTLGCIATATFRLHPLPEAQSSVGLRCPSAAAVQQMCEALVELQLEASAVVALADGDAFDLVVVFEGFSAGVDQQTAACIGAAHAASLDASVLDDAATTAFWQRHARCRTGGSARFKLTFPPAELPELHREALAPLAREPAACAMALYPTVGVAFCSSDSSGDDVVTDLLKARAFAERLGGGLTVLEAPSALRERVDVWGTLPPAFALMQRLKERFDPERRCNRGRFLGHL